MNLALKNIPSVSDGLFIVGISVLAVGLSSHWGWAIACEIIGFIVIGVAIVAKLRGND